MFEMCNHEDGEIIHRNILTLSILHSERSLLKNLYYKKAGEITAEFFKRLGVYARGPERLSRIAGFPVSEIEDWEVKFNSTFGLKEHKSAFHLFSVESHKKNGEIGAAVLRAWS